MAAEVGKIEVGVNFATLDGEPVEAGTVRAIADVMRERMGHPAKGYTPEHDDGEGMEHFIFQAGNRVAAGPAEEVTREDLVEAASLLIAAIEFLDRKGVRS